MSEFSVQDISDLMAQMRTNGIGLLEAYGVKIVAVQEPRERQPVRPVPADTTVTPAVADAQMRIARETLQRQRDERKLGRLGGILVGGPPRVAQAAQELYEDAKRSEPATGDTAIDP